MIQHITPACIPLFLLCLLSPTGGAAPFMLEEMAAHTGAEWMTPSKDAASLSLFSSRGETAVEERIVHEIVVRESGSGVVLRQEQRWMPEAGMYRLATRAEGDRADIPGVNLVDWAFHYTDGTDGSMFKGLEFSRDTWYGSSFWTGPYWTRVGKDWQHSGEKASSVRLFTVPRDGTVAVSGRVYKADVNCGDGVRATIRHNAGVVWQQDIEANDDRGVSHELTLDVRAGDRIRFAIHRRTAIPCDTTHWDPEIIYADGTRFRASDDFAEQPRNGWSYQMETESVAGFPKVYSFDTHFGFHESDLKPGGPVILEGGTSLPLFILSDDKDSCGITGAVMGEGPWKITADLSEQGNLGLKIQFTGEGALPVVMAGAYKGTWRRAASQLEALRRSNDPTINAAPFRERLLTAYREVLGSMIPEAAPELDMWAEIQWDWHRQDRLEGAEAEYDIAAAAVLKKAEALAADLGTEISALSVPVSTVETPLLRYLYARALLRKIALENPLMRFGPLLFCKRTPTSYSHLVMQYYGWRARPGGGLFILDRPGYSLAARDILAGALETGSILEPRLSYDASHVLFSFVENAGKEYDPLSLNNETDEGFFHVYETGVDGSGLRQITRGPYDDLMPAYLPDGGIVFSSTRRRGYARCFGAQFSPRWHVYTLHRMNADGSELQPLSFHDTNEWFPAVSNAGLILYSRWDYIDRDAVTHQNLWATRPDGTNPVALWGNAADKPHCTFQIQPIPGSRKIVFTASAHHSITGGPIVVVDPDVDNNSQQALTRITPGIPFPEAESRDVREYYDAPWPLSEKYFLAGYSPWPLAWEPEANLRHALGIYLIDIFGNRELIYRDPAIGSSNACPLAPRPAPPVVPSQLPPDTPDQGEIFVADVYQGLNGIARGTVKEIRVIQIFPKSTPVGGAPPIGIAGEENGRAVLGAAPVESDGSVHVAVPARKPLLFQLLDERGMAVQTMRSLTYLQPGEKVSCAGCHENRKETPPDRLAIAARRSPSMLVPGKLENEPFSFMRVVQPILDKHCLSCHDGSEKGGNLDLAGTPHKEFSRSYWALCGDRDFSGTNTNPETAAAALVPRFGMRNQVQTTPPGGAYGARGSRLIALLQQGHYGVNLAEEELRGIAQWIDCNAIFYGVNLPDAQARQLRGEPVPMPDLQ